MVNRNDRGGIQTGEQTGTSQPPLDDNQLAPGQDTGAVNPIADSSKTGRWFNKVENLEDEVEFTQTQLEATRKRRQDQEKKLSRVVRAIDGMETRLSSLESASENQDIQKVVIKEVNKRIVAPTILWLSTALILAGGVSAYYGSAIVPLVTGPVAAAGLYYLWRSRNER